MAQSHSLVTVTGVKETLEALQNLPKVIAARGHVKALSRGAGVFRYEVDKRIRVRQIDYMTAARAVPGHPRTSEMHPGDLKRALTVNIELDSKGRGGVANIGFWGFQGSVANYLEFGHVIAVRGGSRIDKRGRKRKTTQTGNVPAYPFMRPAADAGVDEAVEAMAEAYIETIDSYYTSAK